MRVKAVPLAVAAETCIEAVREHGGDMSQCRIKIIVEAPAGGLAHVGQVATAQAMLSLEQIERSRE